VSGFRLGFLTHLHGDQPAAELYPAILDLFVAAEELGFDSGWVAQHHLSIEEGRLPSPLVFLSAVAARTSRIRLGTAIVTLSLEAPLRTAEDASVLDAISGGRLELGLGSGNPHGQQFAAFGKNADDRRALYSENLAELRRALDGRELAGGLTLQPPAAGLADRIWESPLSVDRVRAAARAGAGVLLGIGPAGTVQLELAHEYLSAFEPASEGNAPRIAVVHAAFAGTDRASVAADLWPGVRDNSLGYHIDAGWVGADADAEELLSAMNIHHGTPADILATLAGEPVLELASDLILAVQAHRTSVAAAVKTLEVLATEVAPALGWSPATSALLPTTDVPLKEAPHA
jgi:alkanesulfonate monooxygenase SsuD/methylene tetrahydromethanopterin reductase-like flavin-dependent oxidoreductase (luciferase family)